MKTETSSQWHPYMNALLECMLFDRHAASQGKLPLYRSRLAPRESQLVSPQVSLIGHGGSFLYREVSLLGHGVGVLLRGASRLHADTSAKNSNRVIAMNKAGEGEASNTVLAVL